MALKGVEGVDSVEVTVTQGRATLKLRPGNHATLAQLRGAVAKNGFANKEATIIAAGEISSSAGQPKFQVSGTDESFVLSASPGTMLNPAASVLVEGTVPAAEKDKSSTTLQVKSVKQP